MSTTLPLGNLPAEDVKKANDDDERFWSVTTILGVLEKPALMYWAAEQSALAAVQIRGSLQGRIEEDGEEAVVKWLRDARFRRPKDIRSAAELGTAVHEACEKYALTGVRPETDEEISPYLDRFDEWAQKFQPEYIAAELTVYNQGFKYAGTCDGIMKIDGVPLIFDYKTSRKDGPAYPEVALQLAAYRYATDAAVWRARRTEVSRRRYYLLGPGEADMAVRVPEVEGGICIKISPNDCTAYPVSCGEDVFERFLYIVEASKWVFEMSKTVIGKPLEAPAE